MIADEIIARVREFRARASGLLICAGAGMGVDSGLPDFRGDEGFWRAYPPFRKLGLSFAELANPQWFSQDPKLAWGFYGHRLELYRRTVPHSGFEILSRWSKSIERGAFVFTSNVDGQFQRAGFPAERILEAHGAIDFLQCTRDCGAGIFSADSVSIRVDEASMRAAPPLPRCPGCGAMARPNILMFGDFAWDETRTAEQQARLQKWFDVLGDAPLLVVECGAGSAVPTVRHFSERLCRRPESLLVRINPRQPEVPRGHVGIASGAVEALVALD